MNRSGTAALLATFIWLLLITTSAIAWGGDEPNWSGVKGPFRFQNYCMPTERVFWHTDGGGRVYVDSFENDIYQTRDYPVTGEDHKSLYGLWFDERGNGWVVGDDGLIFHSDDNGYSWEQQATNSEETLNAVTCIDSIRCWAIGDDSFRTEDRGKTWAPMNEVSGDVVDFISKSVGWAADDGDTLYRTLDGGKTWSTLIENGGPDRVYADLFESVKFINKNVGWAAGNSDLGVTSDGGKTWNVTSVEDASFIAVIKTKEGALAISNRGANYCIKNGGKTWALCYQWEYLIGPVADPDWWIKGNK